MKIVTVPIEEIKSNPDNPRLIKDEKFLKLVNSIKSFPEMLNIRPIVVNNDMIVLGGNMRLKACKEAGLKTVPIIKVNNLTEAQQKEFIIKDNVGFGDWDWDVLSNEWDSVELGEWGLNVYTATDFDNYDEISSENLSEFTETENRKRLIIQFENDIMKRQFLDRLGGKYKDIPTKTLSIRYEFENDSDNKSS